MNISEIPTDLITKSQISFRQLAGLSSFDTTTNPSSPPSPLPSSISTVDFRCTYCNEELLRGSNSLICIYCGQLNDNNLKDDLLFKNTVAYGWLLQSLNFNGSERVGSLAEGTGINGGQSPAEDEISLSELLDLKIVWRDPPKRSERDSYIKISELNSSSNLSKADFDDFFVESKRATVSDVPEVQPVTNQTNQDKAFEGQENLTLFQNVLPPDTSGWNADFQSADKTKVENDTSGSGSFDPFVVAETDLSAHMDSVFGQMERLKDRKPNDDSDPFPSADKDWIQDDLFGLDNKKTNVDSDPFPSTGEDWAQDDLFVNKAEPLDPVVQVNDGFSGSGHPNDRDSEGVDEEDWFNDGNWQKNIPGNTAVSQQADQLDVFDKLKDGSLKDNLNDSSAPVLDVDWFENTNWQKSATNNTTINNDDNLFDIKLQNDSSEPHNSKKEQSDPNNWFQDNQWAMGASVASKDDDAFDDWNDFTSSTGNERVAAGDKQAQEVDFGNFLQSDPFSGSFSNKNRTDTEAGFDIFSQVSTASRNANVEAENSAEGLKNDEFTLNATTSPKNDVQMLLSQMHDLSFMLKSELSVPSKPDDGGSSHS